MWTKTAILLFCFLSTWTGSQCVLTGNGNNKDLTKDPNFYCKWFGGSEPKLECQCQTTKEFFIEKNSLPAYDIHSISILNCSSVVFNENSISELRSLRQLELANIKSLHIKESGFYWYGYMRNLDRINDWDASVLSLKIIIRNSGVKIASHGVQGIINTVKIIGGVVESVGPFAFSTLEQNLEISFEGVEVKEVFPQSFKKFPTEKLIFKDCKFDVVPSRTFYEVSVKNEFILKNVSVNVLRPSGFIIINPLEFEVSDCAFHTLDGEGFKVTTRGNVLFKNNVFNETGIAAFKAISVDRENSPKRFIVFESNTFHKLHEDSLIINETSFFPKFTNVRVSQNCDCSNLEKYFTSNQHEIHCLNDNVWTSIQDYKSWNCNVFNTKIGTTIIIAIVCSILFVLVLIGVVCYFRKLYRCGSYGGKADDKHGKLSMIVPDGRTYRETELHVIVERTDLLSTDL